jgi:hypothetical protein
MPLRESEEQVAGIDAMRQPAGDACSRIPIF